MVINYVVLTSPLSDFIVTHIFITGCANFRMSYNPYLKHTTTLFLSEHYILSRQWRVIDLVQINYHGGHMVL